MTGDDFERATLVAAETAFARVMSGVADQVERMPPDLEPADVLRWAGDRTTELLAGFAELPLDRLLGLAESASETPSPEATPVGEPVTIQARRGTTAEPRVWVHLIGHGLTGPLRFGLGELVGPDGTSWTSSDVSFAPAECTLPITAAWSTVLRFRVPDGAIPGAHHGLVVARGAASAAVPITVVIT